MDLFAYSIFYLPLIYFKNYIGFHISKYAHNKKYKYDHCNNNEFLYVFMTCLLG